MTPKFKLGDKVWLIYNYKAREATITGVHHTCKYDGDPDMNRTESVYYNLYSYPEMDKSTFNEDYLYASRDELLASL